MFPAGVLPCVAALPVIRQAPAGYFLSAGSDSLPAPVGAAALLLHPWLRRWLRSDQPQRYPPIRKAPSQPAALPVDNVWTTVTCLCTACGDACG